MIPAPKANAWIGKKRWKARSNIIVSPSQDFVAYPPKIYLPTLTKVTVGFLLSHLLWNVLAAHPSLVARQHSSGVKVPPIHDFINVP